MSEFLRNAREIFSAARRAGLESAEPAEFDVVVTGDGGIRVISGREWSAEALEAEYAPRALYRIRRGGAAVSLDARAGVQRCSLGERTRVAAALSLLTGPPRYAVQPAAGPALPA